MLGFQPEGDLEAGPGHAGGLWVSGGGAESENAPPIAQIFISCSEGPTPCCNLCKRKLFYCTLSSVSVQVFALDADI